MLPAILDRARADFIPDRMQKLQIPDAAAEGSTASIHVGKNNAIYLNDL
ncbi:hypothetical protein [Rhizobium sp. IMFF44]